jgi:polysaccharide export outer membrane protein
MSATFSAKTALELVSTRETNACMLGVMSTMRIFGLSAFVALGLALSGCASTGPFVWASTLPPEAPTVNVTTIQSTDIVNVRVFREDTFSTREHVRPDGKISVPVVGEVMARGRRPDEVAKEIETRLKNMLKEPNVTIVLEQPVQIPVSVTGEVRQSGTFNMEPGTNVLHAIASAGGLNDYADGDKIFLVRKSLPQRVRFKFSDLRSGVTTNVTLQPGDLIVVE